MKRSLPGLLGAAALYLTVQILLPYLLVQRGGLGLRVRGGGQRREAALTFDDGPDPVTTPAVLDALAAAGARATFFVLAPLAQAHPALIARMLAEGHEVELHAQKHVHAWIRSPWGAFLDPLHGAAGLERVTGQRPRFHRPPHGAYTLSTLLGQRRAGLMGAQWSTEAHDWHPQYTPERVRRRVLEELHPGAIIVLHDAGKGGATCVAALPGLLAELRGRGYELVRLADLG